MGVLGERLDDNATPKGRYRRMPPGTGGWWVDGAPLDAGTMHHAQSDLAHLAAESMRPLVWDLGPGTLSYQGHGFDTLIDAPDPGVYGGDASYRISWDRRTARHYGPFPGIADRQADATQPLAPRQVRVFVDANAGGVNSLTVIAALVLGNGSAPPVPYGGAYAALASQVVSSTRTTVALSLATASGAAPAAGWPRNNWRCRNTATNGTTIYSYPITLWLWVGWYATAAGDAVFGVSACEQSA